MSVVEERKHLPALKQFLKLYSVSTWRRHAWRAPPPLRMRSCSVGIC